MNKLWAATALLTLAASPAAAQIVESADGTWESLPLIAARGDYNMGPGAIDRIQRLAHDRTCNVPGLGPRRIDLTIPIALQFDSAGALQRIVVRRMGCPQLDSVMGGVALDLARRGEYRPTGENQTGWYRSEISFTVQ